MTPEQLQLLNSRRPPGRLNIEEAGLFLGFAVHEMRVLLAAKLIKPLGNPLPTRLKHFSSAEIERLRCDSEWLGKATDCVGAAWQERNQRARERLSAPLKQSNRRSVGKRKRAVGSLNNLNNKRVEA
ncbi:MAG: hypothetical protein ACAI35_01570 [Candidatus Methylacidiphilales bacterium]